MTNKVLVYIDQFQGTALPASWEALGAGRSLADQIGGGLAALVVGSQVDALAQEAFQYGADEVLAADDESLADYRPEPIAGVISKVAGEQQVEVVLLPTTTRGRELAGMAAIDLNTGVLVDVVDLQLEGGKINAVRPVFAGKLLAKVVCDTTPQIVTLRVRAFPAPTADSARSGTPTKVSLEAAADGIQTEVLGYSQSEAGVALTDAAVIVSGGRGVANNPKLQPPSGMDDKQAEIWRAEQGFKLLEELASVLGGAVGASRAAVDAGYIPYIHQVGQTGKVVSPDLYIACGISGAIQHQAGMRTSKVIVAINRDGDIPIFKLARYGVVGDLFEIVPALTEAFKKRLGK
jgi:electron transfer flavoprotein alpha subunit